MITNASYPRFEHKATELAKYIEALGIFSILLKNGKIVHYTPANTDDFRKWLNNHNIDNIRSNEE
jgi:hypothetical protein